MDAIKYRAFRLLVALDIFLFCCLVLGNVSYNGQTASAAAYLLERDGKLLGRIFRPLIDFIFSHQPNHCEESYFSEMRVEQ
jgi:hypothetical protein